MDTINAIQNILYLISEHAFMVYVLLFLKFYLTMHAPSVGTIWFIGVLDRFTKHILLAVMSLFGFFQLTKWGNQDWLLTIAIDMILVMVNMHCLRKQVIRNYQYLKGAVVELFVLNATDESVRYLLIEDGGRIIWDEISSNPLLINSLNAEDGDTYFARIVSVDPYNASLFHMEILQNEEFDEEVRRRTELKRRQEGEKDK